MAKAKHDEAPNSLLCTWTGCTRPWTENMGRRLCAEHARVASRSHLTARLRVVTPTRPPEQPWCEPQRKDDDQ